MGGTCGEANQVNLAAAHDELNGSCLACNAGHEDVLASLMKTLLLTPRGLLKDNDVVPHCNQQDARGYASRIRAFNSTPMGVNSISSAHLHVRPIGGVHRTCRWADEIKENPTRTMSTALCLCLCAQADGAALGGAHPRPRVHQRAPSGAPRSLAAS